MAWLIVDHCGRWFVWCESIRRGRSNHWSFFPDFPFHSLTIKINWLTLRRPLFQYLRPGSRSRPLPHLPSVFWLAGPFCVVSNLALHLILWIESSDFSLFLVLCVFLMKKRRAMPSRAKMVVSVVSECELAWPVANSSLSPFFLSPASTFTSLSFCFT